MKHLGDITKINGAEIEIVDVITGGSPCQDLSIAGKRAGLAGARSGLFMEQVRIVKEMREHDRKSGRTGDMVRPRFMVWEMCPEHSAATKGETLRQSSKRSSASQNRKPPILKCLKRAGQLGGATTMKWEDDGAWLGECMTRNTGESPNAAVVSRLSQILEATPQEKYSLSAKACQGILRRAERRGKDLPETLKAVLLMQSKVCAGVNNPAIFCTETQRDCVMPSQALTEVASTLRAGAGAPKHDADIRGRLAISYERAVCTGVRCLTPWEAQSARVYDQDGVWHSLNANENGGMARDSVMCAGFKLGNSEQARSIGYAEEQSPTLNAECGGNKPAVMCLNDQGGNVMGVSHDVSGTLRAQEHGHQPAVIAFAQNQREEVRNVGDKAVSLAAEVGMHCQTFVALDMSHACDVIRDCGEVSPSLQARMGTGGNQVPLTYQAVTGTLSPGAHAGSYNGQDAYNDMLVCGATPDVAHALRAKAACAYREDAETYPVQNMVVRRLTPMECERLQGYPDGWTDIGEWMDSKGKRHKDADSPRYKALGNSIALPFWDFLAKRISAQYLRPVTMGSLFDGIGGFPLVFERHNGKGMARWASEIEEFPIAVTKLRFGEE